MVTKSHPCGFIIEKYFISNNSVPVFIPWSKSLPVKFQQEVAGTDRGDFISSTVMNITDRSNRIRQHIKTTSITSKSILQIRGNLSLNSVHQPLIQPLITPTLRSASGQGKRPGGSPGSRTLRLPGSMRKSYARKRSKIANRNNAKTKNHNLQ